MSGIMRRSLVFMLMLILVSTSNVPVTSDMFTDDAVEIYFSEEDHLWYAAVNPAGDSYWYISIDDATLETVSTSTANG
ncbi:MAG: hypothetical protein IKP88_04195 [Lachnospiraceae bacterium]|nr:hypothetical protein [Lachnospiraceae bacterium]